MCQSHHEISDGCCPVEHVQGVQHHGGNCEQGDPGKEGQVDEKKSPQPFETRQWQILPVGKTQATGQLHTEAARHIEKLLFLSIPLHQATKPQRF